MNVTRIKAWLIVGVAFMPLLFFAMEPVTVGGLADSGDIALSDLEKPELRKSKKKKELKKSQQTRTRNPMLPQAPTENSADAVIQIGADIEPVASGPAQATVKKSQPIESEDERKEREKEEAEKPYLSFKRDAKNIFAYMWSLPHFKKAAIDSLTEVELLEFMKVASAYAQEDEGKSFQVFMAAISNDATTAEEKDELGIVWLARMVQYRHHKSAKHKENARVFSQQKTTANWRTVVVALLGATTSIVVPVVQHYYPTGCSSNITAMAARLIVNQTLGFL